MCFSATASFGASIILTTIGVVSVQKKTHKSQFLFACIPFLFAAQQCCEGVLWLVIETNEHKFLQWLATYAFLIFAQVVWPIYVPLSILLLEKRSTRKSYQKFFVFVGFIVSCYLTYCLSHYYVEAKLVGCHVWYQQDFPVSPSNFGAILYVSTIVLPPFFSHIKSMWILALTVLLSFIISLLFYNFYIVSVWCFFASLISVGVFFVLKNISDNEVT